MTTICSKCERILSAGGGEAWEEVDDFVRRTRPFEADGTATIAVSHGYCPGCVEEMTRLIAEGDGDPS